MAKKSSDLPQFNRQQLTPPPSPPESVKDFRSNSISGSSVSSSINADPPEISGTLTCGSRVVTPTEFFFEWILKVLGVATAILFGIWAPVSYNAQTTGNASNDASQAKVVEKIDKLAEEVEGLKIQNEMLGALRAWEFCQEKERRSMEACQSLGGRLKIESLVNGLASVHKKHKPSSRRTGVPSVVETSATVTSMGTPTGVPTSGVDSHVVSRPHASSLGPDELPASTAPPAFPEFLRPGIGMGGVSEAEKMAMMLGFGFGILGCIGVVGGLRVVKKNGDGKRRKEWKGLGHGEKGGIN